ncbi:hypothetical protein ACFQE1_10165 [Halobium palmae]|uniref:Uncharacterized protein n=1 Tax=Halobium palmae TaxID=1776492 RepID=A0ABD5S1F1_9EURY
MSAETTAARPRWTDPERCPFCGDELTDGGAGFVFHIGEAPSCESRFETWRQRVGGDMSGEWSG